jgi:hypothetical protein
MTARDDYPALAWWCSPPDGFNGGCPTGTCDQAVNALDEIDGLRVAIQEILDHLETAVALATVHDRSPAA